MVFIFLRFYDNILQLESTADRRNVKRNVKEENLREGPMKWSFFSFFFYCTTNVYLQPPPKGLVQRRWQPRNGSLDSLPTSGNQNQPKMIANAELLQNVACPGSRKASNCRMKCRDCGETSCRGRNSKRITKGGILSSGIYLCQVSKADYITAQADYDLLVHHCFAVFLNKINRINSKNSKNSISLDSLPILIEV